MKEVFFSDYLRRKAKKNLVACLAWAVVALTLLLAGIATGVAFILVSGVVAIVIALFVAATRGPAYATYRDTEYWASRCSGPIFSRRDWVTVLRLLQPSLERQREGHRHRLRPRRSLRTIRFRGKAPSRPHFLPGRSLGADQGRSKGRSLPGSARRPVQSTNRNIRRLKELLGKAQVEGLWLHGAVVFTNPRAILDIEGLRWVKAIAVRDVEQILSGRTILTAEQIDSINARLAVLLRK